MSAPWHGLVVSRTDGSNCWRLTPSGHTEKQDWGKDGGKGGRWGLNGDVCVCVGGGFIRQKIGEKIRRMAIKEKYKQQRIETRKRQQVERGRKRKI